MYDSLSQISVMNESEYLKVEVAVLNQILKVFFLVIFQKPFKLNFVNF